MKSLEQAARWLRSRLVNSALILGYHRVAQVAQDPYSMSVNPHHFQQHLEVLSQCAYPISLRELVDNLGEGKLPRQAVVLTFDDGYADALHQVKPMLEQHETPATVFVTTGCLGREFWWDKLERLLLTPEELPEQLPVSIDGSSDGCRSGSLGSEASPGSRQRLLRSLYRHLLPLSPLEREKVMEQLWIWSGAVLDDRPQPRALTPDEIVTLGTGGLIDVGAHTVTHPFLAGLPIPAQRAEIQESKVHLEKILGRPVISFAYPNGSSSHETQAIVRDSGFICACASYKDVVWQGSNPFHVPRFWIPDWDGKAFSRWLGFWLPA